MVSLPAEFRARFETYTGPLDLLLYLIKKEEVDIFDIPISRLVEQYQLYLEVLKDIDPNACGEFLVMAARLMEIKSKLLLPREVLEEDEEELDDPRLDLVRQLLEYKRFKERAILLERRLDWHRKRHHRPAMDLPPGEEEEPPVFLGNLSVWDLLTAFHRVQIAIGRRVPHQVMIEDRSLEEYISDIVSRLEKARDVLTPFDELFTGARTRGEAVGYFIAILMLAKDFRVALAQEGRGPILLRLRGEEEAERLRDEERQFEEMLRQRSEAMEAAGIQDFDESDWEEDRAIERFRRDADGEDEDEDDDDFDDLDDLEDVKPFGSFDVEEEATTSEGDPTAGDEVESELDERDPSHDGEEDGDDEEDGNDDRDGDALLSLDLPPLPDLAVDAAVRAAFERSGKKRQRPGEDVLRGAAGRSGRVAPEPDTPGSDRFGRARRNGAEAGDFDDEGLDDDDSGGDSAGDDDREDEGS